MSAVGQKPTPENVMPHLYQILLSSRITINRFLSGHECHRRSYCTSARATLGRAFDRVSSRDLWLGFVFALLMQLSGIDRKNDFPLSDADSADPGDLGIAPIMYWPSPATSTAAGLSSRRS
jgi:hypothetical protein